MLLLLVFVTLVSVPNSLANSDINNDFNAIYGTTDQGLIHAVHAIQVLRPLMRTVQTCQTMQ